MAQRSDSVSEQLITAALTGCLDAVVEGIGPVYHGTGKKFDKFKTLPGYPPGHFFTDRREVAQRYADRAAQQTGTSHVGEYELEGDKWLHISQRKLDRLGMLGANAEMADMVKSGGYHGMVTHSMVNVGGKKVPGREYAVFDPEKIKKFRGSK
jgi:ADP-Ribosyltransferase in polyvalent proteins